MATFSPQDIENIVKNTSTVDYFFYLERQGRVKFDRQRGHDYYFLTDNEKFSVDAIMTLKRVKADKFSKL